MKLRQEADAAGTTADDDPEEESALDEEPDPELEALALALESRARSLIVRSIKLHQAPFDIPRDDELAQMPLLDLHELAGAVGAKTPWGILGIDDALPAAAAPEWRKLNAKNHLERQRIWLDTFEASLSGRRQTGR